LSDTESQQAKDDAAFLREAVNAGPSRYDQMTGDIYAIYERWGFLPGSCSLEYVISALDEAIANAIKAERVAKYKIGIDRAEPGADYTATAEIDTSGSITDIRFS